MSASPSPSFVQRLLRELPSLLRSARRISRSEADAEDLVQATVVRAIEHAGELRDDERMRAWLLRVQRTVLLNSVRGLRHKLEVLDGGLARTPEPSADLEREIVGRGFADEVDAALRSLSSEWREALLLREVDELSYEEIAEIQRCPVGTVRSRLARARAALLERIDRGSEEKSWQAATTNGSIASRRGTTAK